MRKAVVYYTCPAELQPEHSQRQPRWSDGGLFGLFCLLCSCLPTSGAFCHMRKASLGWERGAKGAPDSLVSSSLTSVAWGDPGRIPFLQSEVSGLPACLFSRDPSLPATGKTITVAEGCAPLACGPGASACPHAHAGRTPATCAARIVPSALCRRVGRAERAGPLLAPCSLGGTWQGKPPAPSTA